MRYMPGSMVVQIMRGTEAQVGSPKALVRKKMAKRTMEDMKPLGGCVVSRWIDGLGVSG